MRKIVLQFHQYLKERDLKDQKKEKKEEEEYMSELGLRKADRTSWASGQLVGMVLGRSLGGLSLGKLQYLILGITIPPISLARLNGSQPSMGWSLSQVIDQPDWINSCLFWVVWSVSSPLRPEVHPLDWKELIFPKKPLWLLGRTDVFI